MKLLFLIIFIPGLVFPQAVTEENLDRAYQNAKKGVYWALGNIPAKKSLVDNDLVAEDKLVASVRLEKEINGIKIESKGVYETTEVSIRMFKSTDRLLLEGYIRPDTLSTAGKDSVKESRAKKKKQ